MNGDVRRYYHIRSERDRVESRHISGSVAPSLAEAVADIQGLLTALGNSVIFRDRFLRLQLYCSSIIRSRQLLNGTQLKELSLKKLA